MPRKHLLAFAQVLALAVRCLHLGVAYGHDSAGGQAQGCLVYKCCTSFSAQHCCPRGYPPSAEVGMGLVFRQLEPNKGGWS